MVVRGGYIRERIAQLKNFVSGIPMNDEVMIVRVECGEHVIH
jgi:hypothetical protein